MGFHLGQNAPSALNVPFAGMALATVAGAAQGGRTVEETEKLRVREMQRGTQMLGPELHCY